jgi:thioredoxin 2
MNKINVVCPHCGGVNAIPTVIAFRNNRIVDQFSGALPTPQIIAFVKKHL